MSAFRIVDKLLMINSHTSELGGVVTAPITQDCIDVSHIQIYMFRPENWQQCIQPLGLPLLNILTSLTFVQGTNIGLIIYRSKLYKTTHCRKFQDRKWGGHGHIYLLAELVIHDT